MAMFGWAGKKLGLPKAEDAFGSTLGTLVGILGGFLIGGPGGAVLGGLAGASAGFSYEQGKQQLKATQSAMQQQQQQAEKLAVEQQTQYNRLNPKKPNVRVLAGQNEMSGTPETQLTDVLGALSSDASMGSNSALGGQTGNLNILDLFLQLNRSRGIK